MLRNGETVPDFTLTDTEGGTYHLADAVKDITILAWIRGEW